MAVTNNPNAPRVSSTPQTAEADSTEQFDVADYLKNGDEAVSARILLANSDDPARIDSSSWVKTFDKNVQDKVAALGANPSKEDVKKVVNEEMFKQRIFKFAVDRASNRIMDRVKEMYSDTFG